MKTLRPILLLPVILMASCASDSDKPESTSAPVARKSLSERMNEDNGYKKDADGNWKPQNDKRSPYDSMGQDPNFAGKDFKKKEYKAGDYAKKSWWGNKDYDKQSYAGNTDGSRFQKSSDLGSKGAREAKTTADFKEDYKTDSYATNSAREAGSSPIKKTSNDLIDNRQKVFEQPEIIDYRAQRQMSMDQSKGILGN
ncbi:MAG: hypothetical protein V4584_14715 [Verrucomicrobiota bacterium]